MPITDYNKVKKLDVDSVSGTPSVGKAQPIIIKGSGDAFYNQGNLESDWSAFQNGDISSTAKKQEDNLEIDVTGISVGNVPSEDFWVTNNTIDTSKYDQLTVEFQGDSAGSSYELVAQVSTSQSDDKNSFLAEGRKEIIAGTSDESLTVDLTGVTSQAYIQLFVETASSSVIVGFYGVFSGSGIESTTGNGDIIVDFSNISDAQDIAVYDQDGNLLDYEIESLDTTAETGVLWCYNSWVRDGTTQAQIAYGSNSANVDRQNVTGTWDNSGQNAYEVFHNPSNNFDSVSGTTKGSVTGASNTTDSQFANAGDFDGNDDHLDTGDSVGSTSSIAVVSWVSPDSIDRTGSDGETIWGSFDGSNQIVLSVTGSNESIGSTNSISFKIFDGIVHGVNEETGTDVTQSTSGIVNINEYQLIGGQYDGGNDIYETFHNGSSIDTHSSTSFVLPTNNQWVGEENRSSSTGPLDAQIDEYRLYTESKSAEWWQADYDASPKAGQVFFSQQAAETTVTTEEQTFSQDVSLLDEDVTKQFSQTVILENKNIPEQFTQDVAIAETDQTATLGTDVAIQDKDAKKTFTQDVTLFDRDAEKTLSTDVSILTENQEASFDQDVILSAGNIETFSQDVTVKAENQTKQLSTDLILENANIPEQFNQDVNIADKNVEAAFSQDFIVADLDNEETFSQDVYISQRMTATFENSVIIAKQPAPNTRNPLTVETVQGTETFTKVLNPTNTYLNVEEVKKN